MLINLSRWIIVKTMSHKKGRPASVYQKNIDARVAHRMAELPPKVYVFNSYYADLGVTEAYIRVVASPKSSISARIDTYRGAAIAEVDDFRVPKRLRGHGIGRRLFQGLIVACKMQGIDHLYSDSMSNSALAVRQRLLGCSALDFYDGDSPEYYRTVLPITSEQVRMSNDRVEMLRPDWPEDKPFPGHVGVYVCLSDIDTTAWPPVELAVSDSVY